MARYGVGVVLMLSVDAATDTVWLNTNQVTVLRYGYRRQFQTRERKCHAKVPVFEDLYII